MIVSLTIVRYKKRYTLLALIAMALHRLPMALQKGCSFWRLLGTGKNGHFSPRPDWQQWGLLAVWDDRDSFDRFYQNSFISNWWQALCTERWTILCDTLQSHGQWVDKEQFTVSNYENYNGPIVVLTRARIRWGKLREFWKSTAGVAERLHNAKGLIMSTSIGETHNLAATFSVWANAEDMKTFAYAPGTHLAVMKQAREEHWLSEELFARFKPIASMGTINGKDPLKGII